VFAKIEVEFQVVRKAAAEEIHMYEGLCSRHFVSCWKSEIYLIMVDTFITYLSFYIR